MGHMVLEDQRRGECTLETDAEGNLVRKVRSIVIHVFRPDGRVLVRVAKRSGDAMQPHAHVFPGAKLRAGEDRHAKVAAMVENLAPLDSGISVVSTRDGEEDKI